MDWLRKALTSRLVREVAAAILTVVSDFLGRRREAR
jgi:hypothetical protein